MFSKFNNKAWIGLAGIMLVLLVFGWQVYDVRFKQTYELLSHEIKKELNMASIMVEERLRKRQYEYAQTFILNWGETSDEIVEITLTSKNDFVLAHYQKAEHTQYELEEEIEIAYSYNNIASLKIRRSLDGFYSSQRSFLYQLIIAYLFIGAVLFFLVHANLRIHKQKHELHVSQRQVRLLLDSTAEGIYGIDLDGKCTFVNKAFIDLLGYESAVEILGKNIHELIHHTYPDGTKYPAEDCLTCKAYKNEQGMHVEDEVLWRKDGSSLSTEYHSYPIFEGGECIGAVVTFLDNTIRKQQAEQIRRSQKMDALNQITTGVVHDTNNMLGVVFGYAELLGAALSDQPKLASHVHNIILAVKRSTKLTNKLLSVSRKNSTDVSKLDINLLLRNQQDMLEKILTSHIKLEYDLVEELWPVYLESGDLEDAIINLSINAMHAMQNNGHLIFQTKNVQVDAVKARGLQIDPGDYVVLSVSDTGSGMDMLEVEKIFEPFYTTKGDKGTGLGLSQVYGFVHRAGGAINVYSELGRGTRFALYFPRYHGDEIDVIPRATDTTDDLMGDETILLVDDERILLYLTRELLENKGYHVFCAENGKQALEILEKETVDLLLTDLYMPEMDGFQLVSIVMEKYPALKVLLASGFSDDEHMGMINEVLKQSIVLKPYNEQVLLQKVRELFT